jgi:hypothetical protein
MTVVCREYYTSILLAGVQKITQPSFTIRIKPDNFPRTEKFNNSTAK